MSLGDGRQVLPRMGSSSRVCGGAVAAEARLDAVDVAGARHRNVD